MSQTVAAPAMMFGVETRERTRDEVQREGVSMRSEAEFAALYQARFSDLAAQLYAYLGDATEAQDVVQEAFVRAWQRWKKIGGYDDPVAWVRRVAWNLATSRHRRIAVIRRFLSRSGPPENQPGMSPDHVALVAALRRLPEQQRRALVMHYLADLPIAEIARDVGVAEGTVKSWLHRGRAELAKHLADDPEPDATAAAASSSGGGTTPDGAAKATKPLRLVSAIGSNHTPDADSSGEATGAESLPQTASRVNGAAEGGEQR